MTGQQKTMLAWAAGILDGEGNIRVKHHRTYLNGKSYEQWMLSVAITNTHRPTIDRLHEIFGSGYVCELKRYSGKPIYRIEWSARKASKVLLAMLPHLFTKREKATAAMEFRKQVGSPGRFGPKRRPDNLRETMEQSANSVNAL